jgi:molybdate transport system substrate-binding protein
MKKFIVLLFILTGIFVFGQDKSVKIAAASNLSYVLEELKSDFNKTNSVIKIDITYGASGNFATQIQQGAMFDLFMSADMKFPQKVAKAGFAETEPKVYAKGKLIMFTVQKIDLKGGLKILSDKNIKTISICNPETAPYGAATIDALTNYKILKSVEPKFIKAETVAQVIQQVITASDIGFTAKSLIFSKDMANYKEGINWVEVDPKLYNRIEQGVIILKNEKDKPDVRVFYDYIFSENAKKIFIKYSYEM